MIKFFRHIRKNLLMENKTGKYFKYAIGEIILVVIGILIALQINNWNESRKSNQLEQALYLKLLENLENDLILMHENDSTFRLHEDIHYNFFNTIIGKASYDSTIHYGKFRWAVNFDPTFKDNYQNKVDAISNDTVRDAVINYFKIEQKTERIVAFFEKLKADVVRPYITNNNLMNLNDVYVGKRYQEVDTRNSVNYEALSKKLNTPEFKQILYELKIKISAGLQNLRELKQANKTLQNIIKGQLKND